jgi:hypothetical protein
MRQRLTRTKDGYFLLSPEPALKVHAEFLGRLQNKDVVWDAIIQTLADYHNEHFTGESKDQDRAKLVRSFIDVQPPEDNIAKIHVVLAVPMIDAPTIKKTIIMIRCYKRLRIGRHDFGKNL